MLGCLHFENGIQRMHHEYNQLEQKWLVLLTQTVASQIKHRKFLSLLVSLMVKREISRKVYEFTAKKTANDECHQLV